MVDEVAEAVALLQRKRADHEVQIREHEDAIRRLDKALAALTGVDVEALPTPTKTPEPRPRTAREKLVALLDEADKEWTVPEVVAEWQRRGDPVEGKDPESAVRAAVKVAMTKRQVFRSSTGRYRSAKFAYLVVSSGVQRGPVHHGSGVLDVSLVKPSAGPSILDLSTVRGEAARE